MPVLQTITVTPKVARIAGAVGASGFEVLNGKGAFRQNLPKTPSMSLAIVIERLAGRVRHERCGLTPITHYVN